MGFITDAHVDSGALRRRLQSSTTGLTYWDESVGRRQFAWDTVNNRWQMVYADSGVRDLSAVALSNGWTVNVSTFKIQRQGYLVSVQLYVDKTAASADTIYTLPTGFRPSIPVNSASPTGTSDDYCYSYVQSSGVIGVTRVSMTANIGYLYFSFPTTDAWPATLPGSASGSIPFN